MDFSAALDLLKQGRKFYRQRWAIRGQDQWVVQQTGYPQGIPLNRNTAQATGLPEGSTQIVEPYFMMYTPWSTFTQWTPSATDLLADDWEAYYFPGEEERLQQEETDAILADPELVAELEAAGEDPWSYSHDEIKMALSLRKLENEDLPDREAIRFRLVRQLLKPVIDRQRETDPPLIVDTGLTLGAETLHAFVQIILQFKDDLDRAKLDLDATNAKISSLERFEQAWRDRYPVPEGLNSNDAILAHHRIRYFQDGWKDSAGFTQATWRLIATLLAPMLEEWRQQLGPELGAGADGWKVVLPGLRVGGADTIGSMTVELVDTPTAEEMAAFAKDLGGVLDPEKTQRLIMPGDPNYPTRPQRLTEAMRLRQSFPDEVAPTTPQRALDRYFVTYPSCDEVEVDKATYVTAERHSGFRSKGGPDEPATASWSSSSTGASGRIAYGGLEATQELPQQP